MIQRNTAVERGDPEPAKTRFIVTINVSRVFCINTNEFPCAFARIMRWFGRRRDSPRQPQEY